MEVGRMRTAAAEIHGSSDPSICKAMAVYEHVVKTLIVKMQRRMLAIEEQALVPVNEEEGEEYLYRM